MNTYDKISHTCNICDKPIDFGYSFKDGPDDYYIKYGIKNHLQSHLGHITCEVYWKVFSEAVKRKDKRNQKRLKRKASRVLSKFLLAPVLSEKEEQEKNIRSVKIQDLFDIIYKLPFLNELKQYLHLQLIYFELIKDKK